MSWQDSLQRGDPLFGLLYRLWAGRQWAFLLGVVVIYNGIGVVVNLITYLVRVKGVVYITSPKEWPLALFIGGVLVPFIFWLYFTLLPESLKDLSTLAKEGRISPTLIQQIELIVSRRFWLHLSIAILVLVITLYHAVFIPAETASAPLISYWYATWWAKVTVSVLVLTVFYVGAQVILKTLAMGWVMRSFFRKENLEKVEIFHPDGCGGLGRIGKIAVRVSYLALLIGIWTVWLTVLPWIRGGHPNFSVAVLLLYGVYISLAPVILFSILWPIHKAMRRYKEHLLYEIGNRI